MLAGPCAHGCSIERFGNMHSYILMHGHYRTNGIGGAMFVARSRQSVFDLALVPANTATDLSAVDVECYRIGHHCAVAMILYS